MKKLLSVILVLTLSFAFVFISGCNTKKTKNTKTNKTKIINDIYGRKVKVPSKVKSVVALGAGGLRMVCYANSQDKVIGVEKSEHKKTLPKAYNYVNFDKFKDLPIIGQGGAGGFTPYPEEIVKLSPDVIIAAYTQDMAEDLQQKTGIPVIGVYYRGIFEKRFEDSMMVLGKLFNNENRCRKVIDFIDRCKIDLNNRTKNIKDSEKPSIFTGACSFHGGHGIEGTYTQFPPFVAINTKSVTDNLSQKSNGVVVELEKIVKWNPDIIFLDPNNMGLVNDHYKDHKDFYKSLKAIREGRVYSQVAYNWYTTNVGTALINSYYAGKVIYPQHFKDINIKSKANEIYKMMLGDKASSLYNNMVDGGLGWSQLLIGD